MQKAEQQANSPGNELMSTAKTETMTELLNSIQHIQYNV